jgi:hypothetical protein
MNRRITSRPAKVPPLRARMHTLLLLAALVTGLHLSASAAAKPDAKVCAQISAIATLNKAAEIARFDASSDSQKKFLSALQSSTAGLVSAHTALAKLVTAKERPGVNYALTRIKKLQGKVAKATPSTALSVFAPWTTEDVANFDVLDTKAAYVATMTTLGAACGTKVRVFLI